MGEVYSNPVSGGVIAAGRYRHPAWLRSMPALQVSQIANTALGSSPALYSWPGGIVPGNQAGLVNAWGGWAVDKATGRIWQQGGGHGDYAGPEIYMIGVGEDAPEFSLSCPPSAYADIVRYIDGGAYYSHWNADGKPTAAHIYWSAQYINGKVFRTHYFDDNGSTLAGRLAFAPNNEAWLPAFDVASGTWDAPNTHGLVPSWKMADIGEGGISWAPCCSDGTYYYAVIINAALSMYCVNKYDPASKTWSAVGDSVGPNIYMPSGLIVGSIYDSKRHELVQLDEGPSQIVRRYNLTAGGRTDTARTGEAIGAAWGGSEYSGCDYDPVRDVYYLFTGPSAGPFELFKIDPNDSYRATKINFTGTVPAIVGGLNSRFKYFDKWDCLLFQPSHSANICAIPLS